MAKYMYILFGVEPEYCKYTDVPQETCRESKSTSKISPRAKK